MPFCGRNQIPPLRLGLLISFDAETAENGEDPQTSFDAVCTSAYSAPEKGDSGRLSELSRVPPPNQDGVRGDASTLAI